MTAIQYYKQTSDMAYPLFMVIRDRENPNKLIANITFSQCESRKDALKILNENDFFSFPETYSFEGIDLRKVELEIRFHYELDFIDCYLLKVCDIIDCRCAKGGKVVFSCDGYDFLRTIDTRMEKRAQAEKESKKVVPLETSTEKVAPLETAPDKSIFDLFDDIVGCSSCFSDLFNFPAFPKFPDITKMIDKTRKNIETPMDDTDIKFYNFSCKIDPDGKVHIKRSSNDGTVTKEFMLGDKDQQDAPKKIEVKDDKPCGDDAKTELRNLIK